MKQILLATALLAAFAAPAFAQDVTATAKADVQGGNTSANTSTDLFLRSGDTKTTGTDAYLHAGPINLSPGASSSYDDQAAQQAAQAAVAQVYDPEAKAAQDAAAAAYTAATPAPNYSASAYNATQSGAQVATVDTSSGGLIKSPFPSWFGGYHPPTLDQLKAQSAAQAANNARATRAQQPQVKRTTAFGTTSQLKAAQQ